jgi:uncharacterized iron-regulated membrane protein
MVFEDEIQHYQHPERYTVTPQGKPLSADELTRRAAATSPEAKLSSLKVYNNPSRTVEVGINLPEPEKSGTQAPARNPGKAPEAKPKGSPGLTVYINPYTGRVIDSYNPRKSFFKSVEMFHRFLGGGQGSIGKLITGISAFFLFVIVITGIILWWPKTVNILKQRSLIKFNASRKRLNHDLHIVTGFYVSIFLVVSTVTGLIMAFNWINQGIFTLTGSKIENPPPPTSAYHIGAVPVSADQVIKNSISSFPDAEYYFLRFPKDSAGAVSVSVLPHEAFENEVDSYFLDQYSGEIVGSQKFKDRNVGQKIRSYVKPIHTGSLYGFPTKIISFLVCILTVTFPITGVIMWLNRIKKRKPAL